MENGRKDPYDQKPQNNIDQKYLQATQYIDWETPAVREYAKHAIDSAATEREKAVRLFYSVRDDIRYDPYGMQLNNDYMRASSTLLRKNGYCVAKAILYAALLRAEGIPSRLAFADVRNHLTTERLKQLMQTDIFVFHGYTELYLEGRWIKATPTFNKDLCEKFGVAPLDFDGREDCMLQPYDREGKQYMEYLRDRGHFADLPLDKILAASKKAYPMFFPEDGQMPAGLEGNFDSEAVDDRKKA